MHTRRRAAGQEPHLSRDFLPRRTFALQDVPGLCEHPSGIWREIGYNWFTGNADRS